MVAPFFARASIRAEAPLSHRKFGHPVIETPQGGIATLRRCFLVYFTRVRKRVPCRFGGFPAFILPVGLLITNLEIDSDLLDRFSYQTLVRAISAALTI